MREIKFRGKAETEEMCGKWVYGWFVGKTNIAPPSIITEIDGRFVSVPVEPETVEQYTGLEDENGKEIFEGDIIGYKNEDFLHNQPKYLVYYAVNEGNYPAFDVKPRIEEITCNGLQFLVENYQVEVLGNKYEKGGGEDNE